MYSEKDLEILEQIVALKFIGLPLDEIKRLLRRTPVDLSAVLRAQRTLLERRNRLLERAIKAIRQAERTLESGSADSAVFRHIIEVIEMQNNPEDWKTQYDALVQTNFEQLPSMSLEAKTELRAHFADLFKEVEGALGEYPARPRAQRLADRCAQLLRMLTVKSQPNPKLLKIAAAYLSGGEQPASAMPPEPPFGGKPVWEFISKAIAIRQ